MTAGDPGLRRRAGWLAAAIVFAVYGGLALFVDFGIAAEDFHADEATYYLIGESLAQDGDLEYRPEDLARALQVFPARANGEPRGPSGVFLKRGVDVTGVRLSASPPFVEFPGVPDPDRSRLFFGKAFVYPLLAAPFVRLLGPNGFLFLNALLLAAAFLASYLFITARSSVGVGLVLASAFTFATVVPVYLVWIAPELFNWAVGVIAYFVWLYKAVAPGPPSRAGAWLRRPWTDVLSAGLIGLLTFSKISNVLLLAPLVVWLAWRRQWGRVLAAGLVWALVTGVFFGANVATSGEWNYQGGLDRRTCYGPFPFAGPGVGLESCDERARNEGLESVIFDPEVFWSNLRANLFYYVVGRNGGVLPYFAPAVFAVLALLLARRRREPWQWLVLGGLAAQALLFIVSQPYTYIGSGGSVGNRYFMGAYGLAVFMLPPIRSLWLAVVPGLAGALFTAPLVLHPFEHSIRPFTRVQSGPLRALPLELTQINDLPMMNDRSRVRIWYGDDGRHLGFQVYYLDGNAFLQEADKLSFWTRGESRAEILIKADQQDDRPFRRVQVTLSAGAVPTVAAVQIAGRRAEIALGPRESGTVSLELPPGFPYKGHRQSPAEPPSLVWTMTISSTGAFVPAETDGTHDTRDLGVRVRPLLIR